MLVLALAVQAALAAERKWRQQSQPRRARSASPPPSSGRDVGGYGGRYSGRGGVDATPANTREAGDGRGEKSDLGAHGGQPATSPSALARSPAEGVEEMHRNSLYRPSLLQEARDARRKIYEEVKRAESIRPLSRSAAFTVVSRRLSGR